MYNSGLYLRVCIREVYTGIPQGVYKGGLYPGMPLRKCITVVYIRYVSQVYNGGIPGCVSQVYNSGVYPGMSLGCVTVVYTRVCLSGVIPVSLLVDNSPLLFPFHCWWITLLSHGPFPTRFTVGGIFPHPELFPFHCWTLLGTVNTRFTVGCYLHTGPSDLS